MKFLIVLTCTIVFASGLCTALDQRTALLMIFSNTTGSGWYRKDNWGSSSFCDWYGIECSPYTGTAKNVWRIDLSRNHLTGAFPDVLNAFTHLESFKVRGNMLQGTPPTIPARVFGLRVYDIGENKFTQPPEFQFDSRVETVSMDHNEMTGKLPTLSHSYFALMSLNYDYNQFNGEFSYYSNIPSNCRKFSAANNQLFGKVAFPMSSPKPSIQELNMEFNKLNGTIEAVSFAANLRSLKLNGNSMVGSISKYFLTLTELNVLQLAFNRFKTLEPEWFDTPPDPIAKNALLQGNLFPCPLPKWCSKQPEGNGACTPCVD